MKNQITPQALALVGSVLLVLAVIGGALYFHLVLAKVAEVAPAPKGYTAAVITREVKPDGMFSRVAALRQVQASEAQAVQYSPNDLGKVDITKVE